MVGVGLMASFGGLFVAFIWADEEVQWEGGEEAYEPALSEEGTLAFLAWHRKCQRRYRVFNAR